MAAKCCNRDHNNDGDCHIHSADMTERFEQLRWKKFPVGSDGFVCLVDKMGDDAAIVQAARVSYGQDSREDEDEDCCHCGDLMKNHTAWGSCTTPRVMERPKKDDRQLIRYLMRHRHSTPFEMAELKLLIRVPMDTWRQWIRHRTANVNEYSTRYAEAIDSAATTRPDEWRLQAGNNKQGSDGFLSEWPEGVSLHKREGGYYVNSVHEDMYGGFDKEPPPGEYLSYLEEQSHKLMREVYEERLNFGVAREQARKDLPLSTYTEAYWKCDLHNILHFLGLRMDSHAQQEIREYATVIGEEIIRPLFPTVWEAFVDYRLESMTLSRLDILMVQSIAHEDDRNMAFYHHSQGNPFIENGWDKDKCRERDECKAKLERMGLL